MTHPASARLTFDEMLVLVQDRSAALRAAVPTADPAARVPGCPDWSMPDLVAHVGAVQMFWAAAVTTAQAGHRPDWSEIGDPEPRGDLLAWSAAATESLVAALSAAGPDRECWTWWQSADAPGTAGAVARHQVQEAAVHALDAQQTAGTADRLPGPVAADGVGEHLAVMLPSCGAWPHDPVRVLLEAGDGGTWLLDLGPQGVTVTPEPAGDCGPAATASGRPEDFVLAFYRRSGGEPLQVRGDAQAIELLLTWPSLS
jgi:uncharacterized protein (TIGR03083 family)